MPKYRSHTTTQGRNMVGARALWRATGMKDDDFNKPIAIANSYLSLYQVVHLKDMGDLVAGEIARPAVLPGSFILLQSMMALRRVTMACFIHCLRAM